jgi:formylmethanofuran dehydrogenase subunit E-like metal-binding protein
MEKKKIGKKQVAIVLSIFVLAILASAQTALTTPGDEAGTADLEAAGFVGAANGDIGKLLGWRASEIAKEELCFVKDAPYILAMTDAGHAIIGGEAGGRTTERCIDGVSESSGCTIGKGNLLLIHRSKEKPLWFAFFNSETKECLYLEVDESVFDKSVSGFIGLSDGEVFTKKAKENIGAELLLNETYAETLGADFGMMFGGNEFSIITIANVWDKCPPYEFLKAAEFHNHICPGLTSGYFIIRYLDENLPLQAGL